MNVFFFRCFFVNRFANMKWSWWIWTMSKRILAFLKWTMRALFVCHQRYSRVLVIICHNSLSKWSFRVHVEVTSLIWSLRFASCVMKCKSTNFTQCNYTFLSILFTAVNFSANGDEGPMNVKLAQNLAIDKEEEAVIINAEEPVAMTFSMKFLNLFAKAAPLCKHVQLSMSVGVPLLVAYEIPEHGYIRYYLADHIEKWRKLPLFHSPIDIDRVSCLTTIFHFRTLTVNVQILIVSIRWQFPMTWSVETDELIYI